MDAYSVIVNAVACRCIGGLRCSCTNGSAGSSPSMRRRGNRKDKSRRAARRIFKLTLKASRDAD